MGAASYSKSSALPTSSFSSTPLRTLTDLCFRSQSALVVENSTYSRHMMTVGIRLHSQRFDPSRIMRFYQPMHFKLFLLTLIANQDRIGNMPFITPLSVPQPPCFLPD